MTALPYIAPDPIQIVGALKLQPFGICVAVGMFIGIWYCRKNTDIDDATFRAYAWWLLLPGWFIGAHLFNALFYEFDAVKEDPLLLFKFWRGISSYGGMLGALAGFLIFTHRRKLSRLKMADIPAYGLLPAWAFGRLGCSLVHDHPGRLTDFFLAIDYPANNPTLAALGLPGGPRHDLGFYEFLYLVVAFGIFLLLTRKPRPDGFAIGVVALLYAPVRFLLEFLRIQGTDPRYVGLTFAQWMCIVLATAGACILIYAYRRAGERAQQFAAEVDGPEKAAPATKATKKSTGHGTAATKKSTGHQNKPRKKKK
ncbi:MAG TPA: prolipoprotein diacylglyceryl transferase [Kofleriaceae bacterium]|nr:prolipoprotein diacylglyceryl transferase [Kofleriaceae bacterium]